MPRVPDTQAVGGSSRALSEGTLARHISSTPPITGVAVRTSHNALECGHGREFVIGSTSCLVAAGLARNQHVYVVVREAKVEVRESAACERDLLCPGVTIAASAAILS
jgi:hypothetical protein